MLLSTPRPTSVCQDEDKICDANLEHAAARISFSLGAPKAPHDFLRHETRMFSLMECLQS